MNLTATKKAPIGIQLVRIFVGLLFIFSGLIKANDPSGLAFKMQEFFEKWGVEALNDMAMTLSVTVITFEIVAGVALLLGYASRLVSILLLLLMIFFTALTGYAIWYEYNTGLELKCGCFGDCIPLTAQQSFGKDILLTILSIVLVIYARRIRPLFSNKLNLILVLVSLVATLLLQWYTLRNLPIVDCLPYKVGNNIMQLRAEAKSSGGNQYETTFTIDVDGEAQKYTYDEYMKEENKHLWELPVLKQEDVLVKKGKTNLVGDFAITDESGEDYTDALLTEDEGYFLLWVIRDVKQNNDLNIDRIKSLQEQVAKGTDVGLFVATSSNYEATKAFLDKNGVKDIDIFLLDPVVSKTMLRTSPGLVLFEKGKLINKWSAANYPKSFEIKDKKITFK